MTRFSHALLSVWVLVFEGHGFVTILQTMNSFRNEFFFCQRKGQNTFFEIQAKYMLALMLSFFAIIFKYYETIQRAESVIHGQLETYINYFH